MTEKKKYNTSEQITLPLEDAEELIAYIEERSGNQNAMAEKLGVTRQAVGGWKKNKKFPQYCLPFLENLRIIKGLTGGKK